jgi:signal transduction histidine kinase/DNA-binding NarL/FixJ family response regulator/HPt (histidine-containing phosphotransfer) domain-containing protein
MTLPNGLARLSQTLSPGLAARLGLACIGAVTIGFILICAAVLLDARRDTTAQAETEGKNIAATVAQDVARNLDLYDLSLQAVVQGLRTPGLEKLDPELRQAILFDRAAKAPYFGFINALDEHGTVIADSRSLTPRGGNWSGRDYFVAQRDDAREKLFIGRPFLTGPGQPATIPISRRISYPDGSFAGVVVGTLRLAYFHDLFSRLTLGPHATIELLRADGMILMRLPFDADDIGRKLPAGAPFFAAPDGGRVDADDPVDHVRRRFLFHRIGTLPLVVGVGLADADIYAAWRGRALALGSVVTALAAIDLLLLLVVRHALARREIGEAALRRSNDQLAKFAAQREKATAMAVREAATKTRFLATMSHELRTPLNSILGYAELLNLEANLEPVQAARLAAMRSAGDQLRDVIDRVLDFSRSEADDAPATQAPTDLAALVEQCRAIVEPMADANELELTCTIAPDVPPHVMADAASLRQVLVNLLSNATKFTPAGTVALRVARGAGERVRFAVADTGIGVPAAQREKLFQPYERLDADRIGAPGTGLGLAIAARLVARMDGQIGHTDNPGGGSIFWAELPLPTAATRHLPTPTSAVVPPTGPLRVLVADDSAMSRDVAAAFLGDAGHEVTQAADGDAAFRLVAARAFDVVLMDLRMPVLGGMEATRRIRALPNRHGRTPIIAVTADVQDDHGAALRAAGFQAWLVKPIDRVSLLAAVAAAATEAAPDVSSPAAVPASDPPIPDLLASLPEDLDHAVAAGHLETFGALLRDLLDLLDDASTGPDAGPASVELAHRVAGDGGQLGFTALSVAARQYQKAWDQGVAEPSEAAEALRDQVVAILEALDQRRNGLRRAATSSAMLP